MTQTRKGGCRKKKKNRETKSPRTVAKKARVGKESNVFHQTAKQKADLRLVSRHASREDRTERVEGEGGEKKKKQAKPANRREDPRVKKGER